LSSWSAREQRWKSHCEVVPMPSPWYPTMTIAQCRYGIHQAQWPASILSAHVYENHFQSHC
jgi:hypothetical protein